MVLLVNSGPVTVGDLRRKAEMLEVGCSSCSHVAYLDPKVLPFDDKVAVPYAYKRMRCSRCGSPANYSRPDARVMGVNGRYPQP